MTVAAMLVAGVAVEAAQDNATACEPLPEGAAPFGIALGSLASVGINIGQNMQADGIKALPLAQQMTPYKSRVWIIGETVFIACSIVNFAALALAPASVLVPLESIQFITNVAYSRIVHKARIPPRMIFGVLLAVVGTVLTVVFGAAGSGCHSLAELEWAWTSYLWWVYLTITLGTALICLRIHKAYDEQLKAGGNPKGHQYVLPITFTLSSALLGGSMMIVQSKVFSELLSMLFQGYFAMLSSWLIYVSLVLVIGCGMLWMVRLTVCLSLYNPLIILPLMVATYILFGGVAGGIYFREFDTLHEGMAGHWGWGLYGGGMLCVMGGLYFIAVAGNASESSARQSSLEAGARRSDDDTFDASGKWRQLRFVTAMTTSQQRMSLSTTVSEEPNGARMPAYDFAANPVVLLAASASNLSFSVAQRFVNVGGDGDGTLPRARSSFSLGGVSKSFAPTSQQRNLSKARSAPASTKSELPNRAVSFQQPGAGRLSSAHLAKPNGLTALQSIAPPAAAQRRRRDDAQARICGDEARLRRDETAAH